MFVVILLLLKSCISRLESEPCSIGLNIRPEIVFIVVIDAGSSGTRGELWQSVLVNPFTNDAIDQVNVNKCRKATECYLNEKIKQTKFTDKEHNMENLFTQNLEKISNTKYASSVQSLLNNTAPLSESAQDLSAAILLRLHNDIEEYLLTKEFNKSYVSKYIPVIFHATAGTRDLDQKQSNDLFASLCKSIKNTTTFDFEFSTNNQLCSQSTGESEALMTFATVNLIEKKKAEIAGREKKTATSIIEIGGASLQIALPEKDDTLAISYMNRGINRSRIILWNNICKENLDDKGVCNNPCLLKGWEQSCSAGVPTKITATDIIIGDNTDENSLIKSCFETNFENKLNETVCSAYGYDVKGEMPTAGSIPNCRSMKGTGDGDKCKSYVNKFLITKPVLNDNNDELLVMNDLKNIKETRKIYLVAGMTNILKELYNSKYFANLACISNYECELKIIKKVQKDFCSKPFHRNLLRADIVDITKYTFDICFQFSYLDSILDLFDYNDNTVIVFSGHDNLGTKNQDITHGWSFGSMLTDFRYVIKSLLFGRTRQNI